MTEKFQTLHPDPDKQGTNIDKVKYEQMRNAIVAALRAQNEHTFRGLQTEVEKSLEENFEGSIGWYYTTVKLDLEAREVIERVPDSSPQVLRLIS